MIISSFTCCTTSSTTPASSRNGGNIIIFDLWCLILRPVVSKFNLAILYVIWSWSLKWEPCFLRIIKRSYTGTTVLEMWSIALSPTYLLRRPPDNMRKIHIIPGLLPGLKRNLDLVMWEVRAGNESDWTPTLCTGTSLISHQPVTREGSTPHFCYFVPNGFQLFYRSEKMAVSNHRAVRFASSNVEQ